MKTPSDIEFDPNGVSPVSMNELAFEAFSKSTPHGRIKAQHWATFPVLRVAYRDHGGGSAHFYAVALTARIGGRAPVRDHLIAQSSLLIPVMSRAESIGDSAHPLIIPSAVAMTATSFWSLRTRPDPHPSR